MNLRKVAILILTLSFALSLKGQLSFYVQGLNAQAKPTKDFYEQIKKYDLSAIWMLDSVDGYKKPEPLGFIGSNYQRFYIHFCSAIKQADKPYEYLVCGKTRVKNNICNFIGTIKVEEAKLFPVSEAANYEQGYAICSVKLYEDSKQKSTGVISGKLHTHFMVNEKDFKYDDIFSSADGFINNGFIGTWTNYKNQTAIKCHWGDFRIPQSGDLDVGAGEVYINEKHVKNGWEDYVKAWSSDTPDAQNARKREMTEWWK